jgi:hypothetical protein
MNITTGTRVSYKGRTGTVRDTYSGYCPTHSGYDCNDYPGARIDWDDAKRASSILFTKLQVIG